MSFNFKKGFQIYYSSDKQRLYPQEWFYSNEHSNDERMVFLAYDANLFPLPDIKNWSKDAIKETCEKISKKFKNENKEIYLDGYLLNKETKTLSKDKMKS